MKVPLTSIYEDLNFASDRLSTQIRTLTIGVLALVWLFLSRSSDVAAVKLRASNEQLLVIAGLCILTLLIDVVQYLAFYCSSNSVRRHAEKLNHTDAEYDEKSPMRLVQQGSFWAKQITAVLAAGLLLRILFRSVS